MDRRFFMRSAAAGAAAISTIPLAGCGGGDDDDGNPNGPDMLLVNGTIHTMDDQDSTVSSIGIRDEPILDVNLDLPVRIPLPQFRRHGAGDLGQVGVAPPELSTTDA